jgi:hypothetical protein
VDTSTLARVLIGAGVVLAVAGVLVLVAGRLGLGRLPGDITFGSGNVRVFAPIGTMILLSILLTVALNVFLRR